MYLHFTSSGPAQRTPRFSPSSVICRSPQRQRPGWLTSGFRTACIFLLLGLTSLGAWAQCSGDKLLRSQAQVNAFPAGCTQYNGNIRIEGADITDLSPLTNLQRINGNFQILFNANLASLAGLSSLTSVAGELLIQGNGALTSLAGLEKLTRIGGRLAIINNATLTTCAIASICQFLATPPPGGITISGNASGCASVAQVQANCSPLAITGFAASPDAVCTGSPVTFTATATNAATPYNYTLTNGSSGTPTTTITGSASTTAFSQTLTASGSGSQSFTLTVSSGGQTATATTTVTVNALPTPTITVIPTSNVYTGGDPKVIYLGYGPQSVRLQASGGQTYAWSPATGLSNASIADPVFSPTQAGRYSFTVRATNSAGCSATQSVTITVIDVRASTKNNKVFICHDGNTISIDPVSVPDHLGHGDKLGACGTANARQDAAEPGQDELRVQVLGNPVSGRQVEALIKGVAGQALRVELVSPQGRTVAQRQVEQAEVLQRVVLPVGSTPGVLLLRVSTATQSQTVRLLKVD